MHGQKELNVISVDGLTEGAAREKQRATFMEIGKDPAPSRHWWHKSSSNSNPSALFHHKYHPSGYVPTKDDYLGITHTPTALLGVCKWQL